MLTRFGRLVLPFLALGPLAACAASSATQEPLAPTGGVTSAAPPEERPALPPATAAPAATPELAADDFGRAEQDLDGAIGKGAAKAEGTPLAAGGADEKTGAGSVCEGACRAYSSMQRSASRLCDLAGNDDPRCVNAKERLGRARERVQSACPMCDSIR